MLESNKSPELQLSVLVLSHFALRPGDLMFITLCARTECDRCDEHQPSRKEIPSLGWLMTPNENDTFVRSFARSIQSYPNHSRNTPNAQMLGPLGLRGGWFPLDMWFGVDYLRFENGKDIVIIANEKVYLFNFDL